MCGIVGVVGVDSMEKGLNLVERMTATILHRGPDDEGQWGTNGFAFGMRRLSIIDLPGGHQPMWTEDGVGIVLNGEIYNYRLLRQELEADGYSFKTHSDTEVVLNLFHRDGLAAIDQLEGMFAICLYDPRAQKFHLVRDRLGKKPLYYGWLEGSFYFSSELKAILAVADQRPSLNLQSLYHYLTLRYVPAPESIWQGLWKLEPASILSFNLSRNTYSVQRYWQVDFVSEPLQPGRDYVREFEDLFLPAVEKRLTASDVPVGTLLSGGLDSSAVSAAAVELGHRDFHTFSVAFEGGGEFDETGFAREVAAWAGANHHEVFIGERQFLEFLPDLVYFADEPLADLASIPLNFVCRLASNEVKVVLSGEGGDEILAGYNFEQLAVQFRRMKIIEQVLPRPIVRFLATMAPTKHYRRVFAGLVASGVSGWLSNYGWHMSRCWVEEDKSTLWPDAKDLSPTEDLIRSWYAVCCSPEPIDQMQQVMSRSWLVEDLLMKADKMSMANSLELRTPFLDHRLVEWAASLPLAWKVGDKSSGPVSKRILREFCKTRLPEHILHRPKRGFPVPAYEWLKGARGDWAADLVAKPSSRLAAYFDSAAIQKTASSARKGELGAAHKIWALIILELWLQRWL
jgi:asparagine synthase (glutamine-hydrolysing)